MRTIYHVVPHEDRWAVRKQNSQHNSRVTDNKDEAVEIATRFARNQTPSRVVLHDEDGRIDEKRDYAAPDEESHDDHDDDDGMLGGWLDFDAPSTSTALAVVGAVAIGLTLGGWFYLQDKRGEQRRAAARRRRATPTSASRQRRDEGPTYPHHDEPGILHDPVAVPPRARAGDEPPFPGAPQPVQDRDATDPENPDDPANFRD